MTYPTDERNRLVEQNLPLVKMIVGRLWNNSAVRRIGEYSDVISIGTLGLIHAVDHYDPMMGCMLSTYACACIKRSVTKAAKECSLVRTPQGVSEALRRQERDEDHAYTQDTLAKARQAQLPLGFGKLLRAIADNPCQGLRRLEDEELVRLAFRDLTQLQRLTLIQRFGLFGTRPMTLQEIGDLRGVSDRAVSNLERTAIKKLRLWAASPSGQCLLE